LNVNIQKSPIPILWLDTFAVIRLAKYEEGETLNEVEKIVLKNYLNYYLRK
jgi:predicted secreted protein